jgi:hypothetical protein
MTDAQAALTVLCRSPLSDDRPGMSEIGGLDLSRQISGMHAWQMRNFTAQISIIATLRGLICATRISAEAI